MQLLLLEPEEFHVDTTPRGVEAWREYPGVRLYLGDCIEVLRAIASCSVDACVTDGPYGIGFMGREWDTFRPDAPQIVEAQTRVNTMRDSDHPNLRGRRRSPGLSPSAIEYDESVDGKRRFEAFTERWARELLRVLKPGAHLLSCGAPRSAHRMICGLEDAGFEIRDSFAWLFGQGFPKSRNVDEEAGLGTALKPGHEPIALARKPCEGTIEENVARWGVGALAIEACRIPLATADDRDPRDGFQGDVGRWPANVVLDEVAAAQLDAQAGTRKSGANPTQRSSSKFRRVFSGWPSGQACVQARGFDAGGASRFYYVAKPSRWERDFGCEDMPLQTPGVCTDRQDGSAGLTPYAGAGRSGGGRNFHPTVKPIALMRWLVALVTPPGGSVIDLFLGSGTTGMACVLDGYSFIGIDNDAQYLGLADARIAAVVRERNGGKADEHVDPRRHSRT